MIISHKHEFIFIKTRKTAGTSIEVALEKICGEKDIVTPVLPEVPGHRARNYESYTNHTSAAEVRDKLSPEIWGQYFKFAIERNPWDKVVSMYYWRLGAKRVNCSFKEFCLRANGMKYGNYLMPTDFHLYAQDGKLLTDYIGRYESLDRELDYISSILKIKLPSLTREKSVYRNVKSHYSQYYDNELLNIVKDNFNEEIGYLDYQFDRV